MAKTNTTVVKLLGRAEDITRDFMNLGQARLHDATTAALEAAEKMLAAAHRRVKKLRTQMNKQEA